jgi:pimeloyl-ACP methyl ester carboxylesterase
MSETSTSITLRDGRRFGYADYGPADGVPVVYFHGTPGSRLNPFLRTWGVACGIRFIAVDRPGYGLSTFYRDRRMLDLAEDVRELVDHLGLDRVSLAGISGGGPPVLACAYGLGDRVVTSVIVSGGGPPESPRDGMSKSNVKMLANAEKRPALTAFPMAPLIWVARRFPEKFAGSPPKSAPEVDRQVQLRPEVRDIYIAGLRNARPGDARAMVYEFRMYGRPWGFDLGDIRTHIEIWHGRDDESVPLGMAQYVADHVPDSELHVIPNAGHLLAFDRWRDIFGDLAERASSLTH